LSLITLLRESTWGYPIISAIHVLGIAWFGGTVLVSSDKVQWMRRIGLLLLIATGVILFLLHPAMYANSMFFRLKIVLLAVVLWMRPTSALSLALWGGIVVASRGIAFW
jgi:hypothetical protein